MNQQPVPGLPIVAKSFGSSFTMVEVAADDWLADEPQQLWIAFAKPSQALTLVLATVPEGWTAELVVQPLMREHKDCSKS
ncbi:hypothetical protein BCCGELA001_05330 [Bradyrhizobium sp. CCGE-LA001]|nr:hypothetical protein BCCGELA001_05330 [Bradyrhizobium sp. CCGE-LA001]